MDTYECTDCSFAIWTPIAAVGLTFVGLYDDARFPGRCIVVLRDHVTSLDELRDEWASQFMIDAKRVGSAVKKATGAHHVNYALLGNVEPHLHWHVVPRFLDEPNLHRPPWEHPQPRKDLPPHLRNDLITQLRDLLA